MVPFVSLTLVIPGVHAGLHKGMMAGSTCLPRSHADMKKRYVHRNQTCTYRAHCYAAIPCTGIQQCIFGIRYRSNTATNVQMRSPGNSQGPGHGW